MEAFDRLDADQVRYLLGELSHRCQAQGIATNVVVIGGAAMLLHGSHRGDTEDIDATIRSDTAVHRVAAQMAHEFGLASGWFVGSAQPWAPESDGREQQIAPGFTIASKETLLAMKMIAYRGKDFQDIYELCEWLGITTAEEIRDVVIHRYGEEALDVIAGYGGLTNIEVQARQIVSRL